jgi:hypothetical protein
MLVLWFKNAQEIDAQMLEIDAQMLENKMGHLPNANF